MSIDLRDQTLIGGVMRSVAEFVDSIAPFPSDEQYDLYALASTFPHPPGVMRAVIETMPRAYLRGHGARQQEFDAIVDRLYPDQARHEGRYILLEKFSEGRTSQEAMSELFRLQGRWWLLDGHTQEYPNYIQGDDMKKLYDQLMSTPIDSFPLVWIRFSRGSETLFVPRAIIRNHSDVTLVRSRETGTPIAIERYETHNPMVDIHKFLVSLRSKFQVVNITTRVDNWNALVLNIHVKPHKRKAGDDTDNSAKRIRRQ